MSVDVEILKTSPGEGDKKVQDLFVPEPMLWHGDWFDLYSLIEPRTIDLILTDPPYGVLEKHRDTDKPVELARLEITFDGVLKPAGLVILFCNLDLARKVLDTFTLFVLRSLHVWQKPVAIPISELMPLPNAEFLVVLKRNGVRTGDTSWHPFDMISPGNPYHKRSSILESPSRRMLKSTKREAGAQNYLPSYGSLAVLDGWRGPASTLQVSQMRKSAIR